MKNRVFLAAILAAALTACGGGSDKVVEAISPAQAAAMAGVQAGPVTATAAALPASATSAPHVGGRLGGCDGGGVASRVITPTGVRWLPAQ